MKLYKDEKNGQHIHVVDGLGFPLSSGVTGMGRAMGGDEAHKQRVIDAINDWKAGTEQLDLLTNDKPFEPIVEDSYPDYEGKTLDEILAEFCPEAPEEI